MTADAMTVTEDALRGYELVVGLEVHVELATATKLFSASPNRFGDEPNTNIDPVTLGLPGALPVLNRQAVELAMRIGLALNCTVKPCTFHRKNYFYPDMPKAYQISQYDEPLNVDGWLVLADGTRVGIERAHMEEDTGKSTHVGGSGGRIHGSGHSLIDFNRAGVPLVEIVEPARHPHVRAGARIRQRTARDPRRDRCVGRQDGRGVDARRRQRQRPRAGHAAGDAMRDQEPQLGAFTRPRHRVRGAAPGRPRRSRRDSAPGDQALGRDRRPHSHVALQGGRRRLPLLPRARPRPARPRPGVDRAGPVRVADAPRRATPAAGRRHRRRSRQRGRDGRRRPRPGSLRARGG